MANHERGLDTLYRAIADPTRRAVVAQLTRGPATVSELAAPHDMALPTFLRHIRVLEASGLVRSEKRGRVRTCHVEAEALTEAQDWLDRQRRIWAARLDRLAVVAGDLETSPKNDTHNEQQGESDNA